MTEIQGKVETVNHDILSKEEIDLLLTAIDTRTSQEVISPPDPFNEIAKLDDLAIQKVMRKIDRHEIAKALKSVDSKVQNKIFKNMTKRASTMLKENMEYMGPVRLIDVIEAQMKFFSIIYHLADIGEITIPKDFILPDNLDQAYETFFPRLVSPFKDIEEFTTFLTERRQPEELYGNFSQDITVCRFFDSKNNENFLSDIKRKNKEQGMGNYQIPNTKIKLINYSICPKCSHVFSFKELTDYYANPKPDKIYNNRAKQYREDTRVFCYECDTYFLPALVIADGTPKIEVQFLCRVQTANAIESFYRNRGKWVLSANKGNILIRGENGKTLRAIRNDVSLKQMSAKPTLISNLLQYTPANLALNLIDGSNFQKGDVLFGVWQ